MLLIADSPQALFSSFQLGTYQNGNTHAKSGYQQMSCNVYDNERNMQAHAFRSCTALLSVNGLLMTDLPWQGMPQCKPTKFLQKP